MAQVHKQHSRDPNFPIQVIEKIETLLRWSPLSPEEGHSH